MGEHAAIGEGSTGLNTASASGVLLNQNRMLQWSASSMSSRCRTRRKLAASCRPATCAISPPSSSFSSPSTSIWPKDRDGRASRLWFRVSQQSQTFCLRCLQCLSVASKSVCVCWSRCACAQLHVPAPPLPPRCASAAQSSSYAPPPGAPVLIGHSHCRLRPDLLPRCRHLAAHPPLLPAWLSSKTTAMTQTNQFSLPFKVR